MLTRSSPHPAAAAAAAAARDRKTHPGRLHEKWMCAAFEAQTHAICQERPSETGERDASSGGPPPTQVAPPHPGGDQRASIWGEMSLGLITHTLTRPTEMLS